MLTICPTCAVELDVLDDVVECKYCGEVMRVVDWEPLKLELFPPEDTVDDKAVTASVRVPEKPKVVPNSVSGDSKATGNFTSLDLLAILVDLFSILGK